MWRRGAWGRIHLGTVGGDVGSILASSISPPPEDFSPHSACHHGKLALQMCPPWYSSALLSPALPSSRCLPACLPSFPYHFSPNSCKWDVRSDTASGPRLPSSGSGFRRKIASQAVKVNWKLGSRPNRVLIMSAEDRTTVHDLQLSCTELLFAIN